MAQYSSGLLMYWHMEGEEPQGRFREIFSGGGDGYLWDFESLEEEYINYKE